MRGKGWSGSYPLDIEIVEKRLNEPRVHGHTWIVLVLVDGCELWEGWEGVRVFARLLGWDGKG